MFLHVFDSGFRPTNHTTQYDDSSRSRHVTSMPAVAFDVVDKVTAKSFQDLVPG